MDFDPFTVLDTIEQHVPRHRGTRRAAGAAPTSEAAVPDGSTTSPDHCGRGRTSGNSNNPPTLHQANPTPRMFETTIAATSTTIEDPASADEPPMPMAEDRNELPVSKGGGRRDLLHAMWFPIGVIGEPQRRQLSLIHDRSRPPKDRLTDAIRAELDRPIRPGEDAEVRRRCAWLLGVDNPERPRQEAGQRRVRRLGVSRSHLTQPRYSWARSGIPRRRRSEAFRWRVGYRGNQECCSDRRRRVVLDAAAHLAGAVGSGEAIDQVQCHVDAGGDAGRSD